MNTKEATVLPSPDYDVATQNLARLLEAQLTSGDAAARCLIGKIVGGNKPPSTERPAPNDEDVIASRRRWYDIHEAYRIGGLEGIREFIQRAYPELPPGSVVAPPQQPSNEELILGNGPLAAEEVASMDLGKYCGYLAKMRWLVENVGEDTYMISMADAESRSFIADSIRSLVFADEQEFP